MKAHAFWAVLAACSLLLVPASAKSHTAKAAKAVAATPVGEPLGTHLFRATASPGFSPFSPPPQPICVSLTNPKWTVSGNSQLCGVLANSAKGQSGVAYPGIQYASAGRWAAPTPFQLPSQATLNHFGPVCPQGKAPEGSTLDMAETCQFLNVWVPTTAPNAAPYPVMVFIHGGAFLEGAGSLPVYNGAAFAGQKVILVTLNYRLGALGFLVGNSFGTTATGNYGIMDQQMALNWVHDNISAFGGDPNRVTIFGESAGAMSVGLHLYSTPSSTALFSAAIMESNPVGLVYSQATATGPSALGNQFLAALCKQSGQSCKAKSSFNPATAPVEDIVAAQSAFLLSLSGIGDIRNGYTGVRGLPFQPVIDGKLIVGQPYQGYASGTTPKPVVFGINHDEGAVFAALVAAKVKIGKPANNPLPAVYKMILDGGFSKGTSAKLATENSRYKISKTTPPDYQANAPYYNRYGQAASNVVLDYDFSIGNVVMANSALSTGKGAPQYAYYFTQAPVFDIYGSLVDGKWTDIDNGACDPKIGNYVCHGSELPYVFDTLTITVPAQFSADVTPPLKTFADAVNAAWAAFATNPSNPGSIWTAPYTNNQTGSPAVVLNADNTSWTTGAIDPNAVFPVWSGTFAPASQSGPAK